MSLLYVPQFPFLEKHEKNYHASFTTPAGDMSLGYQALKMRKLVSDNSQLYSEHQTIQIIL